MSCSCIVWHWLFTASLPPSRRLPVIVTFRCGFESALLALVLRALSGNAAGLPAVLALGAPEGTGVQALGVKGPSSEVGAGQGVRGDEGDGEGRHDERSELHGFGACVGRA